MRWPTSSPPAGLGFAGILALMGVMLSLVPSPLRVVAVGISGAAAVVAWALPLKLNIVVAIAVAVVCCLLIDHRQQETGHGETDAFTLLTIACLTVVTVLTRCFFFLSDKPWSLPGWARSAAYQYAPLPRCRINL